MGGWTLRNHSLISLVLTRGLTRVMPSLLTSSTPTAGCCGMAVSLSRSLLGTWMSTQQGGPTSQAAWRRVSSRISCVITSLLRTSLREVAVMREQCLTIRRVFLSWREDMSSGPGIVIAGRIFRRGTAVRGSRWSWGSGWIAEYQRANTSRKFRRKNHLLWVREGMVV